MLFPSLKDKRKYFTHPANNCLYLMIPFKITTPYLSMQNKFKKRVFFFKGNTKMVISLMIPLFAWLAFVNNLNGKSPRLTVTVISLIT